MIDERNFYDLPIKDLMKQYDEVRKVLAGLSDDYIAECIFVSKTITD